MKEYNKITSGFVTQRFQLVNGEWKCAEQAFTAGDSEYETVEGEPLSFEDIPGEEVYCPFVMVII